MRCAWLRPTRMGSIATGETHFVLYEVDGSRPTLYSEPRFIEDADYGQIVADGFTGWSAEAELGDNDAVFRQANRPSSAITRASAGGCRADHCRGLQDDFGSQRS